MIVLLLATMMMQSVSACATACDAAELRLEDVSCSPPHGGGPDGRAWLHLTCGKDRAPWPYDWQLAELSGARGDIFAWGKDPTYAYAQGEAGAYQVGALTSLGEMNAVISLSPVCDRDRPLILDCRPARLLPCAAHPENPVCQQILADPNRRGIGVAVETVSPECGAIPPPFYAWSVEPLDGAPDGAYVRPLTSDDRAGLLFAQAGSYRVIVERDGRAASAVLEVE